MIYFRGGLIAYARDYTETEVWDFGMLVIGLGQQHRFNMNHQQGAENHGKEEPEI